MELDKYIKWSDGFIVVYSITSRASFLEAQAYLKHIHIQFRNKGSDIRPIILVGNKRDLDRCRFAHRCSKCMYVCWIWRGDYGFIVNHYELSVQSSSGYLNISLSQIRNIKRIKQKHLPCMNCATRTLCELRSKLVLHSHFREVDFYEGQEMADRFNCLFQETSAKGNVNAVDSIFHNVIKEIQQERALCIPQPLIISEAISPTGSLPKSMGRRSKLSTKSSGTSPKLLKKSSSTFKIFNKGFRIFN